MNERRNMILAIAFSVLILLGWNIFYEQPRLEAERARQAAESSSGSDSSPTGGSEDLGIFPDFDGVATAEINREEALQLDARFSFFNSRIEGSINLRGGLIDDLVLRDYYVSLEAERPIILFEPLRSERPYYADYGWSGRGGDFPDRESVWRLAAGSAETLRVGEDVTIYWLNDAGVRFEKIFSLDENYLFTVRLRVVNESDSAIDLAPYGLVLRTAKPDILDFYILHEGLIGVIDGSLEEIDYDDLEDDSEPIRRSVGGWLGITDKYWLAVTIPAQDSEVNMQFQSRQGERYPLFQSHFVAPSQRLAAGETSDYTSYLYAGAKETYLLDAYEEKHGIGNFDLAVDFGWFYFLTKPIYQAIHYLNGYLGNFGLAILALTVLVKMILLPLAYKSYASMSRMKLLQPQMMELKEQFGDNKDGLRQAMMELYKQEKINPMSGCLPILLQIPVFFSLYKVLFVTIEMRHAPFYGWIHDLSAPDPLGILTAFGLIDWQVPGILALVNIGLWPIIMGVTMWLQQKMNPTPPDPMQAKIFAMMPFLFTFLLASFPAGLVIYWAWNNTLTIAQQWFIMRLVNKQINKPAAVAEPAPEESRKKSLNKTKPGKTPTEPVSVKQVTPKKSKRGRGRKHRTRR